MKIGIIIARFLLGIMFTVFGLNGFLHFIPAPPPTGLALQFFTIVTVSHYMVPIFALQLIGGVLLLVNRFVPIALVILGPIIVNILIYHVTMAQAGIAPGLLAFFLWLIVFSSVSSAFAGIFVAKVPA